MLNASKAMAQKAEIQRLAEKKIKWHKEEERKFTRDSSPYFELIKEMVEKRSGKVELVDNWLTLRKDIIFTGEYLGFLDMLRIQWHYGTYRLANVALQGLLGLDELNDRIALENDTAAERWGYD